VFILGLPTKNQDTVQASISKEAVQFGDIVQGNFIDTYRNLSTKNIYGNLWVSLFCNNTEIVVKTDDDTFVDLYAVYFLTRSLLAKPTFKLNEFILCPLRRGWKVNRRKSSKWYVSYEEWTKEDVPGEVYPDFCPGNFHVTNPDTARRLVEAARHTKILFLEDVWVSGYLVSKLNFTHIAMPLELSQMDQKRLLSTKTIQSAKYYHWDYLFGIATTFQTSHKLHKLAESCYIKQCWNNLYMNHGIKMPHS